MRVSGDNRDRSDVVDELLESMNLSISITVVAMAKCEDAGRTVEGMRSD